jgi:hypothetical protein
MFNETNQKNGWKLKIIDNCKGKEYGGSLKIGWN